MELDLRYRIQELRRDYTIQSLFGFPLLLMHILLIVGMLLRRSEVGATLINEWSIGSIALMAQAGIFLTQYISTIYWMRLRSEQHKVYFVT